MQIWQVHRWKAARVIRAVTIVSLLSFWTACGIYYRPVANPIIPTQPNPSFSHLVVVVSGNGANNPGASTTIDVSGDTAISQAIVGVAPVHAALVQNPARVYVANSMDDTVSSFSPSTPAPVTTVSLPSTCSAIPCSMPVFVASTETATVYVANIGDGTENATVHAANSRNGTVAAISISNNVMTNTIPVGVNPSSLAELPNGQKVYVTNAGNRGGNASVMSINTIDKSVNAPIVAAPAAPWISPVWVLSRSDSQRVYVLDKGSGYVSAIDPFSDTVKGTVSVGVGAAFMLYDPTKNRVYVTNAANNTVFALDASTDALSAMKASVANPVNIAPLPDGTRVYVSGAAFPNAGKVTSRVTVLNAVDLSLKTIICLTSAKPRCAATPFELSMAAAADSSRVYVGNCDAGNTAIIQTSNDTLLLQMNAPLGAFGPPTPSPPLQTPVFVLAGP
jgi:YVTN family beta-propeller protein